ncbi:MAG: hypothetical protein RL648_601 [Verrucomicrobiota bacterium]
MPKRSDPIDALVERVGELDAANRANLIARLARERRLLKTVVNTLREGVIVLEASGQMEYANPAALQMLGLREGDLGELTLWRAVPDLRRTMDLSWKGFLKDGANVSRELELSYPQKRIVRLYFVPIDEVLEETVQVSRFAVILSDITQERVKTLKEIENERVKSILELSAGVAHELGNPLNSLTIHLQLMQRQLRKLEDAVPADKFGRSLEACAKEVERLDGIIRHFLEAVRPTAPQLQDVDLIGPLEESIRFLGLELEGAGIRVDIELGRTLPLIQGDRDQIKQVFFNIVKNARQAMKAGGTIRIRAFSDDEYVYVQIGDSGEGMSEESLAKVFEPYFTTKRDGHGLGMMIVERIMRDHGGQIGIDSRPGVGTLVTLQFPQKHRRLRLLESR